MLEKITFTSLIMMVLSICSIPAAHYFPSWLLFGVAGVVIFGATTAMLCVVSVWLEE